MLDLVQEIDSYSPHAGQGKVQNGFTPEPQPKPYNPQPNNSISQQEKKMDEQREEDKSCTRFFKMKYYEQYFKISEQDVLGRVKSAIIPPFRQDFMDSISSNPDFYGVIWVNATIILLLGTIGNFSNYVYSKFSNDIVWDSYFFRLQYIRYAFVMVYSFAIGVPVFLYFLFKIMGNKQVLANLISIYGYTNTCFVPAILVCIIPFNLLQWVLMIYAFANSSLFLIASLKKHIEGIEAKKYVFFGVLVGIQLTLFLMSKLIFLN